MVTITVHDDDHNPVQGATVTGTWSDGASGVSSCTTDSSGQCTVEKQDVAKQTTSVTFTVNDVTHDMLAYVSADNDGGSDIVIQKE